MQEWTFTEPGESDLGTVSRVSATLMRGSIRVLGADSGPARLEVSEIDGSPLTARLADDGALTLSNGRLNATRILATALRRSRRQRAVVSLRLPRTCEVELWSAVQATMLVAGLSRRVRAHVGTGELTLAQLSGPVEVDNSTGRVDAMGLSGPVQVTSAAGEVVLAQASGSVRARTVNGPLTVFAVPEVGARVQLASTTGPVTVGLPELRDCTVELATEGGRISSQFPELDNGAPTVQRTVGSAMRQLWVRTGTGDIVMVRHAPPEA